MSSTKSQYELDRDEAAWLNVNYNKPLYGQDYFKAGADFGRDYELKRAEKQMEAMARALKRINTEGIKKKLNNMLDSIKIDIP